MSTRPAAERTPKPPRATKRDALTLVALLAVGVLVLAGVLLKPVVVSEPHPWSVAGTADDGKTLLLRSPGHGQCERISVAEPDESTPGRIRTGLRVRRKLCLGGVDDVAVDVGVVHRVRLAQPLASRRVVGEGMTSAE